MSSRQSGVFVAWVEIFVFSVFEDMTKTYSFAKK